MVEVVYPCFWEIKDEDGRWRWAYFGRENEELARSSHTFANRTECARNILAIKLSAPHPVFYRE
jgi:uncharacterized protein YegP (UPF0339 family)